MFDDACILAASQQVNRFCPNHTDNLFRADLLKREVSKAVLLTPGEVPQELPMEVDQGRIRVEIPKLTLWGILSLE